MPRLHVAGRDFDIPAAEAAPLIEADILYWDRLGGSDRPEGAAITDPDHLHVNPEMALFDLLERAIVREGLPALRRFVATRFVATR